jgi:PRC-barrel domain/Cysteine rich repeat
MNKAVFLAAALMLAPLPAMSQGTPGSQNAPGAQNAPGSPAQGQASPQGAQAGAPTAAENAPRAGQYGERGAGLFDRLAGSGLRDRLDMAIERVEDACGEEIEEYCGDEPPGQGRVAACVYDHADVLSRRCTFAIMRTARNIRNAVENIADECWNSIQTQCGNEQNIGQCAVQKSASLPQQCQTVVAVLHEAGQKIMGRLRDMPVFSSDNKDVGRVIQAVRGPDGKLQSIQIQVGRFLGIGNKVVTIPADKIHEAADRIMLRLNGDQVRDLPETKSPG